jgi:hypothetical protein
MNKPSMFASHIANLKKRSHSYADFKTPLGYYPQLALKCSEWQWLIQINPLARLHWCEIAYSVFLPWWSQKVKYSFLDGNEWQWPTHLENQVQIHLRCSNKWKELERTASKSCHVMTHAQLLLLFASTAPFDIVKITFQKDWTPFWQATR